MKRRILSLLVALCLIAALLPMSVLAASYPDTDGHWAESSIDRWSEAAVVQGTDGEFRPDLSITRAQIAAIFARLLRLPAASPAEYHDLTADAWYADAVSRCAAAGILTGYPDGTFRPNDPVTREQACAMLARALGISEARRADLSDFPDAAETGNWAKGYVAAMLNRGILTGLNGKLAPKAPVTRAQFVTMLDRAIAVYADEDGMTVKAADMDEDGVIVVVAEDVKIKDAPAGTKVVAAASAKKLNVNGKSVDADQVHTVPETPERPKSAGSSHSHSYDETTHKCSCGQFDPAVVATINDSVGYLTFADAVAAAKDGDTVKLMKNIAISPELTDEQKQESKLAAQLTVNTDIVLDMNGKKLSVTEGDFGKASPLLIAVTGGTVTVKGNGEINCEAGESQVYGINVNGGNLIIEDGTFYGAITAVQVQQGSLIIKGGTFDLAPTCKSMVPQYAKYIVNVIDSAWRNGTATVSISGGTFGFNPSANPEGTGTTYLADGYQATETAEGSGFWTITAASDAVFVAEVGGVQYTTLAAAIAAAQDGATVKLVSDTTLTSSVEINKSITLDLNGKTIHYTGENQKTANPTMSHRALNVTGGNVTIKNGSITTTVAGTDYSTEFDAVVVKSGAEVTLKDMNITINDAKGSCLYVFEGGKATVKSGSYTNTNTSGEKLLLNQADNKPQAIFVEGGTFNGRNPKIGDNSGNPSTFLAEGYEAVGNEGKWTVKPIFAGGTGTAEDPFAIQNAEQFKAFRDNVNAGNTFAGKTIELTDDIDLSSVENWVPIGTSTTPFKGVFDGNGKTINNLKITGGGYIGLFGYITGGAEIKNVRLAGADVSGSERVGGLVGQIIGDATVANCSIDAASKVTGNDSNTGGLIGAAQCGSASTISLSSLTNYAAVTNTASSNSRAGGIIGQVTTNANVTITNCHNHGVLSTANGYAGGIVAAYQNGSLTINGCANTKPLSDFTGTYKADLIAWITSVRTLTINADGEVSGDMIGCIESEYSRNFKINGSCYFLNKTSESFTFASALENKQSLDTVRMDRIIDFYTFAKTKNPNFEPYPNSNEYWEMFTSTGGFGGDGWPQLLKQYNEAYPDRNLKQEEFTPTWRDAIMYFYKPAQGE